MRARSDMFQEVMTLCPPEVLHHAEYLLRSLQLHATVSDVSSAAVLSEVWQISLRMLRRPDALRCNVNDLAWFWQALSNEWLTSSYHQLLHAAVDSTCPHCGYRMMLQWDCRRRVNVLDLAQQLWSLHVPMTCSRGCHGFLWHGWWQRRPARRHPLYLSGDLQHMEVLFVNSAFGMTVRLLRFMETLLSHDGVPATAWARTLRDAYGLPWTPSAVEHKSEELLLGVMLYGLLSSLQWAHLLHPWRYVEDTPVGDLFFIPMNLRMQRQTWIRQLRKWLPRCVSFGMHLFVTNHASVCPATDPEQCARLIIADGSAKLTCPACPVFD